MANGTTMTGITIATMVIGKTELGTGITGTMTTTMAIGEMADGIGMTDMPIKTK